MRKTLCPLPLRLTKAKKLRLEISLAHDTDLTLTVHDNVHKHLLNNALVLGNQRV